MIRTVQNRIWTPDMGVDIYHAGRPGAAAADWWDPNGDGLCIWAAYQPKGAANLAASYVDLSGNGNNAGVGVAPTWDAVNGWKFDGATQYLTTTFVPANDQSQTALMQFTTWQVADAKSPFGVFDPATDLFAVTRSNAATRLYYRHGNAAQAGTVLGAGNWAGNVGIAGNMGYLDGAADCAALAGYTGAPTRTVYIGAINNLGAAARFTPLYVQAFALYDCTLSGAQVAAVAAAMAAL